MNGDDRHVFDFDPGSPVNSTPVRDDASGADLPRIAQTQDGEKKQTRRKATRVAIFCGRCLGVIFFALIAAIGTLYYLVSQNPLSIAFLVKPIESAINRELSGFKIRISDTVMQRKPGGRAIAFRMRNVELFDDRGQRIGQAPLASIRLSMAALALGRVAPSRIHLIQPRIRLSYDQNGGLSFAINDNPKTVAPPNPAVLKPNRSDVATISLMQTISKAFRDARQRRHSTSYLKGIGIRDAVVIFDQDGRQSFWQMPVFTVGVSHGRNESVISGSGSIAAGTKPWAFDFRINESAKRGNLNMSVEVRDLVPSGLADNLPILSALKSFDFPVTAQSRVQIANDGSLQGGELQLNLAAGLMQVPGLEKAAFQLSEGVLKFAYDHESQAITLKPSRIAGGGSNIVLAGKAKQSSNKSGWTIDLNSQSGTLASPVADGKPVPIERLELKAFTDHDGVTIEKLRFSANGGTIAGSGSFTGLSGHPNVKLNLSLGPVATDAAKYLWPSMISPSGRRWFFKNVSGGQITGGRLAINLPGTQLAGALNGGPIPSEGLQMQIDGDGLVIDYLDGSPPLLTGFATARLAGQLFQVDVPQASLVLPDGEFLGLRKGVFLISDHRPDNPDSRLTFQVESKSSGVLALLRQPAFTDLEPPKINAADLSGNVSGLLQFDIPLKKETTLKDITVRGQARLRQLSYAKPFGSVKLNGGSVDFGITDKALDARGDILLNGIPAKIFAQRIFGAEKSKQPPLRVTATLDNADRDQLGLELGNMVQGDVPVVLTIQPKSEGVPPDISVQANLTDARIAIDNVGWSKRGGRVASLQFNVKDGPDGRTELRDFKIFGDDISIDGWLAADRTGKLSAFYFPDFSFNVITHLELTGEVKPGGIWDVKARGSGYDGREFFRSLFTTTSRKVSAPKTKVRAGLDLQAEFTTMLGFSDTALRNVKISMSRRKGKLTQLKASGTLGKNSPLNVELRKNEKGKRTLVAEAADAGRAFKLVGFYPNVVGGQTSLAVGLDVNNVTDTRGTLWARNFRILGDPIVGEVLEDADQEQRKRSGGRNRVQRAVFDFDRLRMPFSVGQGQFVLHRSYINGPLLGATLKGKVDFARDRVNVSGTYVPLYGLNAALGEIPILGQILVGRAGEGIFGITFGVSGSLGNPDVQVNPISLFTPGVFRGLMEFQTPSGKITPRQKSNKGSARPRVSNPLPGQSGPPARRRRPTAPTTSGWTTQTESN